MKRYVSCAMLLVLGAYAVQAQAEAPRKISEQEVRKLFDIHAGSWLFIVRETSGAIDTTYLGSLVAIDSTNTALLQALTIMKERGLITYRLSSIKNNPWNFSGKDTGVALKFTDEGKRQTFPHKDEPALRCVNYGRRTVDKVVDIADDGTVLLAGTMSFNDLGILFSDDGASKGKFRYRVKFAYDAFLEQFQFKTIEWSPWEKEEWRSDLLWLESDGGHLYCKETQQ